IMTFQPQRLGFDARRTLRASTERSRDHVLMLMMTRLFGRNLSDLNQPLDQRMVFTHLPDTFVAAMVGSTVTNPRDRRLGRVNQESHRGRTHAAGLRMRALIFDYFAIRGLNRFGKKRRRVFRGAIQRPFDLLADRSDGDRARYLAGFRTTHP